MSWNEEELSEEMNCYFVNTTKESFLEDLKQSGVTNDMLEDVEVKAVCLNCYCKLTERELLCPNCGSVMVVRTK